KAGEFDPEKWIASLGITSQKSCECLAETWAYCLQQTQGHPDASLLLWRGVEMVEILSTLSMDIDTLREKYHRFQMSRVWEHIQHR
ncbi:GTP pyrophosphokinase, partial [human gut metagenome]